MAIELENTAHVFEGFFSKKPVSLHSEMELVRQTVHETFEKIVDLIDKSMCVCSAVNVRIYDVVSGPVATI